MSTKEYERITLCHKPNQFSRQWNCEYGFSSVKEADKRMFHLKEKNENLESRLFPTYHYTPILLHKMNIMRNLTTIPSIEMKRK